ncbi:MAG: DnaD domain protein [Lachnospiraceae bacterium]|nr:DnaD domain protein [Lachnospiraceae bacterium]
MNRVNIYRAATNDQTSISNVFIDEYMADANDAQLKIYLFLIRMMNANLPTSVTDIADKFNYTEKDVLRSLMYWESRQLLALDFDAAHNLSGIRVLSLENVYEAPRTAPRITPVLSFIRPASMQTGMTARAGVTPLAANRTTAAMGSQPANGKLNSEKVIKPDYSLDEIKDFKSNEDIEQLLMVTEQYVARPLTRSDMETILFLYDRLDFSTDLIDYLVQHCVERGKKDFRYMEKVALAWHEQGITSPADAQNASRKYDKVVYTIMKSLGKNANPAPKELEYINKWTKEYGFLLDVIQEACDKTVMTTDNHRFAYADGILTKWYHAGVHHKADIPAADAAYKRVSQNVDKPRKNNTRTDNIVTKNKFNNFAQNTYDFDELEQNILSN